MQNVMASLKLVEWYVAVSTPVAFAVAQLRKQVECSSGLHDDYYFFLPFNVSPDVKPVRKLFAKIVCPMETWTRLAMYSPNCEYHLRRDDRNNIDRRVPQ
jgi:hypothetical protein